MTTTEEERLRQENIRLKEHIRMLMVSIEHLNKTIELLTTVTLKVREKS